MIRKRFDDQTGLWCLDILVQDEWYNISEDCNEEQCDEKLVTLKWWYNAKPT